MRPAIQRIVALLALTALLAGCGKKEETVAEDTSLNRDLEMAKKMTDSSVESPGATAAPVADTTRAPTASPPSAAPAPSHAAPPPHRARPPHAARPPAEPETYRVPVFYGTNRMRASTTVGASAEYGGRVNDLQLGTVYVSIPVSTHTTGVLERPREVFGWRIERLDPRKHFTVVAVEPQLIGEWLARVRGTVTASSDKEALVYVHGFNTSFEDAALRAAQLSYDLNMDKEAAFMFSWPSAGTLRGYVSDEEAVRLSRDALRDFIYYVTDSTGATRVSIVAHSLGSRLVASVLEDLKTRPPMHALGEVVFAAPDINAEEFRRVIAPRILGAGSRLSVYTSTRDKALMVSRRAHSFPRLGEGGAGIFNVAGFDKIDATHVDLDAIGHGYYAETRAVIDDIAALIRLHQAADRRMHLRKVQSYPTTWQLR
jgi:esterase/lipase superfamily enzyme